MARAVTLLCLVEGPSDVIFFPDVLRLLLDAILDDQDVQTDVVVELLDNDGVPRGEWVVDRASQSFPDAAVVAVHVDGSADPRRELRKSYEPIEAVWRQHDDLAASLVPLVPVREMEAWVLADLEVVRDAVGAQWDASSVTQGDLLDRPERLADPKRTLADLMAQARRPRRRKRHVDTYLPLIAERLEPLALRRLPSFQRFEQDLRAALALSLET